MAFEDLKQVPVAEFISKKIEQRGLSIGEVAANAGWDKPAALELVMEGRLKLPINKVRPLADVLGVSAANLLRLVMVEYMPEAYEAVCDSTGLEFLSNFEREALDAVRQVSRNGQHEICVARSEPLAVIKVPA